MRNTRFLMLTLCALIVSLVICAIPVFAVENGVAGDQIVDLLTKLLGDNTTAIAIYTAIASIVGIGLRILLKKIPTGMQTIAGFLFWKIAAALFGDGVMLENHRDPEFVKSQLIKKYPLLSIKIK